MMPPPRQDPRPRPQDPAPQARAPRRGPL